ncbi:ADP-ribosylglycohydrolase family protein [Robiginitalea sp. M366]|uniref:ADP-ribosylglycohydrolase family protein n=1 Tax=Robiginitalea aestuariiviva TaxID=3036903 RepID=UPI00240DF891|nr:ADP-ribosylglycohydrolase family protein [Robiginitalea aestuariiviva]MDG1571860.1 ADP-ribosylglycohydrolase family protein [Robiginitalea aestuariiviva]
MDYGITRLLLFSTLFGVALLGCNRTPEPPSLPPSPQREAYTAVQAQLDTATYQDRVLGALVGSAIGDAMGAATEMWNRRDIQRTYGYVNSLSPAIRYQSPEGTWDHNLSAGATTDDTRWKALMGDYLQAAGPDLGPGPFARHLAETYSAALQGLDLQAAAADPDLLEAPLEQVDWLREWARVALAYQEGPEAYLLARDRFYGGEMSCAGMLYTPVFGLVTPDPDSAYRTAYDHALFDLGYARDISALVAAMTQVALHTQNMDSVLNTAVFVDPLRFQDSRLVGRIAQDQALAARDYVRRARLLEPLPPGPALDSLIIRMPEGYPGSSTDWRRQEAVYAMLEEDQQAIAFHAGEIWQILIAALEFGEGDFMTTMAFIVNYGRDNDTVAAVAGMILGAQQGFSGLPVGPRNTVLGVNREVLGIDLRRVAHQIGDPYAPAH